MPHCSPALHRRVRKALRIAQTPTSGKSGHSTVSYSLLKFQPRRTASYAYSGLARRAGPRRRRRNAGARARRGAPFERPSTMEVTVAGEEIDPTELSQPGWEEIRRRQRAFHDAANAPPRTPPHSAPASPQKRSGSRPPPRQPPTSPLPATDIKIVLRPRGGLDLRSVAQASLADAVMHQAGIPLNPADQVRIQQTANYMLISTPSEERAKK